tara:strand:- start:576 stop:1295 length:720 start_codon:yes stop_codon:yes gene_type:complete
MAFFRGPNIAHTDKIIASYDAASNKSYTTGTQFKNLIDDNNNLTINGSPTFSDGQNGDGYGYFTMTSNQTTKYFQTTEDFPFPTTAVTLEIWCRTTDATKNQALISYAVPGDSNENLLFYAGSNSQKMNLFGPTGDAQSGQALTENAWTQVVYTRLSSSGATLLYYNSVQEFSTTLSAGTNFITNGTLNFGQEQDSEGGGFDPSQCWVGDYSIIRIYDTVLTAPEIRQNYIAQKNRFGL